MLIMSSPSREAWLLSG